MGRMCQEASLLKYCLSGISPLTKQEHEQSLVKVRLIPSTWWHNSWLDELVTSLTAVYHFIAKRGGLPQTDNFSQNTNKVPRVQQKMTEIAQADMLYLGYASE